MALKDALSAKCTRQMLHHEIEELMEQAKHEYGTIAWEGHDSYKAKMAKHAVEMLEHKHYSGPGGQTTDSPMVIRTYVYIYNATY